MAPSDVNVVAKLYSEPGWRAHRQESVPTSGMLTTASPLCLLRGELVARGICVGVLKGGDTVPGIDKGAV